MAREKEIILDNKELNENWQYQKVLILLFFFCCIRRKWTELIICISYENFLKISFSLFIPRNTKINLESNQSLKKPNKQNREQNSRM